MAKLKEILYVAKNGLTDDVQNKIYIDLTEKQEKGDDVYVAKIFDCDKMNFSYLCLDDSLFPNDSLPSSVDSTHAFQLWNIFDFFNAVEWNGHSTPIYIISADLRSGGAISFRGMLGKAEYALLEVAPYTSHESEYFDVNNDTIQVGPKTVASDSEHNYGEYTLNFPQDYSPEKTYLVGEKIAGSGNFGRFVEVKEIGANWGAYWGPLHSKIKIKKTEIVINNTDGKLIDEALQKISESLTNMEWNDCFVALGFPNFFIYAEVYDIASKKTYLVFSNLFANFMGTQQVIEKTNGGINTGNTGEEQTLALLNKIRGR